MMMTTIKDVQLTNGLLINFSDESNRYYGDYHRVCVVATITYDLHDLPVENSVDKIFRCQVLEALGEQVSVVKHLERMGVSSAEVEDVRTALIDDFLRHTSAYLSRPGYLHSLVSAELKKRTKNCFYG